MWKITFKNHKQNYNVCYWFAGWVEWNELSNFQEGDQEMYVKFLFF